MPSIAFPLVLSTIDHVTPQKIGRYEVLYPLSRGGMAVVFLARDPAFERQVAIKVLPPQFTHDPQFRGRFEREAKVIAGLEHPYIVPVYDYGEEGQQPYIVMRFMPGGTLADRIAGHPMPLDQIALIVQRLAEAVDAVHRHGIVHCDLKPSNVLFDVEGRAFLSDFGIAKLLEGTPNLANSPLIGTPAYMSPEQCVGGAPLDGRSDIYSLGLILYEMFAGRHPYGDEDMSTGEMMRKQISEPPPPLEVDRLGLPGEVNSILAWALAKQPEARYATAGMMARALTALQAEAIPPISKPIFGPRISRPVSPLMPTPPSPGGATTEILSPTRPLLVLQDRRRWAWALIPVLLLVLGLAWWGVSSGVSGFRPTATANFTPTDDGSTPTVAMATTIAPVGGSATPSLTLSPSSIRSSTATIKPTLTPSRTPVPTHTFTPTRRLPTSTPRPTNTLTPSPTATCPPGQFFDNLMNQCRPIPPPPATETPSPIPP